MLDFSLTLKIETVFYPANQRYYIQEKRSLQEK
jgi:hypothetical protein